MFMTKQQQNKLNSGKTNSLDYQFPSFARRQIRSRLLISLKSCNHHGLVKSFPSRKWNPSPFHNSFPSTSNPTRFSIPPLSQIKAALSPYSVHSFPNKLYNIYHQLVDLKTCRVCLVATLGTKLHRRSTSTKHVSHSYKLGCSQNSGEGFLNSFENQSPFGKRN